MSQNQRGKKELRKELADTKGKLRSQIQAENRFKDHVLRMVSYADGVAKKLKDLEGLAELAAGYLNEFGSHDRAECQIIRNTGSDCTCGYNDAVNALAEAAAKKPPESPEAA